MLKCASYLSRLGAMPRIRAAVLIGVATMASSGSVVQAQEDPNSVMKELTDLQQQMAGASDPCPYMAKLKTLITRIANDSPETYQALKPSLDLMNSTSDDGCSTTEKTPEPQPSATQVAPIEKEGAPPADAEICPGKGFVDAGDRGQIPCRPGQQITAIPARNTQVKRPASQSGAKTNTTLSAAKQNGSAADGACATDKAGASMPMAPGTTASTCSLSYCRNAGEIVELEAKWKDPDHTEVVGYFTNNSVSDVTCTSAFHKNGEWTEYGTGVIKAGAKHQGGEFGGMFSMGVDSSTIKYACFLGNWPENEHGRFCNVGLKFTGQTLAGTDRENKTDNGIKPVSEQ